MTPHRHGIVAAEQAVAAAWGVVSNALSTVIGDKAVYL
jgi:hypothetical protein